MEEAVVVVGDVFDDDALVIVVGKMGVAVGEICEEGSPFRDF